MRIAKDLKWALVLSGGGARGLAHVGVLNALAEMGVPEPSLVVGTSMGAIIGGLYACGMSPGEMIHFVLEEFDITEYLDSFVFRINGPMGKVFRFGQILGSLATRTGIDSGQQIMELLEDLTGGKTFGETKMPFRCNAVDLSRGREVVISSGSIARAIRASMSFPAFFEPLPEGDMYLVDGGLADNLPVHIARDEGYRRILAVDVGNFKTMEAPEFKTGAQIVYRSMEVIMRILARHKGPRAALTIRAAHEGSAFDFSRKQEFIALGEQVVREGVKAVTAFFSGGPGAYLARKRYRECGISEI
ncbi:MAG: patatin-like phospholipase family protein [Spirochaetaceae bacterium]|jgi:NTE family protein|nr:patatin-like phospholipase family protein [Spirochaetaceae bacterium]